MSRSRAAAASAVVLVLAGLAAARMVTARGPAEAMPPRRTAVTSTWGAPDVASVTMIRRAVITQSAHADSALVRCEAGGASGYRRCALPGLAALELSGRLNASILMNVADPGHPGRPCNALIHSLAGDQAVVSVVARTMLREEPGDTVRASRALRALAAGARRLARSPGWHSCATPAVRAPAA